MWPWGHLAVGYLLYSPLRRLTTPGVPTGREVLVLAIATQIPDLVDKPLAWGLGVFPSGYAVAHSIFVAGPLGLVALVVAARVDRPTYGLAYLVGHWSHLAGDVVVALALDNPYSISRVLWPLIVLPGSHTSLGTIEQIQYYFGAFLSVLASPEGPTVFVLFFGPLATALALWLVDGAPVARELFQWVSDPR